MKGIYISLTAVLAAILVMMVSLYGAGQTGAEGGRPEQVPRYHVQIVTKNADEHFWTTFKTGAVDAGKAMNVYVEFVDVAQDSLDSSLRALEKAIYSGVDGVAFQAQDVEKTGALVKKARDREMAVLTFENDRNYLTDIPTVGSSSYDIGFQEGEMGVRACGGQGRAAIILNGNGGGESGQNKNLKLQGMMDAFSKNSGIQVQEIYSLDSGMFETEKLMSTILTKKPKIDLILCTDERSTPGIAQVLVDENSVGEVAVVGYGAMPQTLSYIDRGVIYGSICPDAYHIGYDCVQQLAALLDGNRISDSVNTDLFSIDSSNVGRYRVSGDEKDEKD